jgi:hypothetical protein
LELQRLNGRGFPLTFNETYGVKFEKAVGKLVKDRDELLAFYGLRPFPPQTVPRTVCRFADRRSLPAEHWKHIRTTNLIESVFATVRNRTRETKGCLNRKTALAMVFRRLPEVIQGIAFKDGIKQLQTAA